MGHSFYRNTNRRTNMFRGSKTYFLPFSDIEVEVGYYIENSNVYLEDASINGEDLAYEVLGVLIDTTKPEDLVSSSKYIKMEDWLQSKLDDDGFEILGEYGIKIKSERDEHFNQKDFI